MQKVIVTVKTPKAVVESGKPVVKYDVEENTYIVASTKSKNNLLEELRQAGTIPTSVKTVDVFLDKNATEKAVDVMVDAQNIEEEIKADVKAFVKKALDNACVYYKPIIRKK